MNAQTENPASSGNDRRRPMLVVWAGLAMTVTGALSYFLYFFQFPALRDTPLLNLPVVWLGLAAATVGWVGVFGRGGSVLGKASASVAFLMTLAVAGMFSFYIFFMSYQLPDAATAPVVGATAPEFSLADQDNNPVSLSDYRSRKVVLVFYRGFW